MKNGIDTEKDEMRTEYDFSQGIKNPYAGRFAKGSNLVLIEPELFVAFPSEKKINAALRLLLKAGAQAVSLREKAQKAS